jgi:hypothetical protein
MTTKQDTLKKICEAFGNGSISEKQFRTMVDGVHEQYPDAGIDALAPKPDIQYGTANLMTDPLGNTKPRVLPPQQQVVLDGVKALHAARNAASAAQGQAETATYKAVMGGHGPDRRKSVKLLDEHFNYYKPKVTHTPAPTPSTAEQIGQVIAAQLKKL